MLVGATQKKTKQITRDFDFCAWLRRKISPPKYAGKRTWARHSYPRQPPLHLLAFLSRSFPSRPPHSAILHLLPSTRQLPASDTCDREVGELSVDFSNKVGENQSTIMRSPNVYPSAILPGILLISIACFDLLGRAGRSLDSIPTSGYGCTRQSTGEGWNDWYPKRRGGSQRYRPSFLRFARRREISRY